MLELLVEYSRKRGLTVEPGFKRKYVDWALVFDSVGRFLDILPFRVDGSAPRGRPFEVCPHLEQPEIKRGGKGCRHFLVDTVEIVALYTGRSTARSVPSDLRAKHDFFVNLLVEASGVMPVLGHIASSLRDETVVQEICSKMHEQKTPPVHENDTVTLAVKDDRLVFLVESADWHQWWRNWRAPLSELSPYAQRCLVSGEAVRPALTHPAVGGLSRAGGRSTGDRIASFKQGAFRSYRLSKAQNAAVSESASWSYRAALEDLIDQRGKDLAGAKVVLWYKERVPEEHDPYGWLWIGGENEELQAERQAMELLKSVETGRLPSLSNNHFYALTMSANDGRVAIRDWMEGQFKQLAKNIASWFEDLSIAGYYGDREAKNPGIERVVTSLLPERKSGQKYKGWIKSVGSERIVLWHCAVRGDPIPYSVVARLMTLHRAFTVSGVLEEALKGNDQPKKALLLSLLYTRMGLIKAYHFRRGDKNMTCKLNENHPDPAYHFGRLMATLAYLQSKARGDKEITAGIVQRFYGAASTTPGLVIGRLVQLSNHHLKKLEASKPPLARWCKTQIENILAQVEPVGYPKVLDLNEQTLFALGYYQQLASRPKKDQSGSTSTAEEEETNE